MACKRAQFEPGRVLILTSLVNRLVRRRHACATLFCWGVFTLPAFEAVDDDTRFFVISMFDMNVNVCIIIKLDTSDKNKI
jgi:hypothetical protein